MKAIHVSLLQNGAPVNTWFVSPLLGDTVSTVANDQFKAWIQHGASRDPLYSIESLSECFYRNRKAALICDGTESFGITYNDFIGTKFWLTFSMEKAAGEAIHTSTNTMGSIVYLNLQGLNPSFVNQVHVVCQFDACCAISAGGCEYKF